MSTILDALRKAQENRPGDEPAADGKRAGDAERPAELSGRDGAFDPLSQFPEHESPVAAPSSRRGVLMAAGVAIAGLALGAAGARIVTGGWNPFAGGEQVASVESEEVVVAKTPATRASKPAASPRSPAVTTSKARRTRDTRKAPAEKPVATEPASEDFAAMGGAPPQPAGAAIANDAPAAPVPAMPPAALAHQPHAPVPGAIPPPQGFAPAGGGLVVVPGGQHPLPGVPGQPGAQPQAVIPGQLAAVPGTPGFTVPPMVPGVPPAHGIAPPPGVPGMMPPGAGFAPASATPPGFAPPPTFAPGVAAETVPGEPPAGTLLDTPPSDAPEVSLLFIKWSRDLARRVASLRGPGGKLMLVHEGDIIEGMRVASIRPDAVELQWRGTNFLLLAAR